MRWLTYLSIEYPIHWLDEIGALPFIVANTIGHQNSDSGRVQDGCVG